MTWLLQLGASLGGLSFLAGLITALSLWRKSKAEAAKTGADATSVLTDTALKAATRSIESLEKHAEKLSEQLDRTTDELRALRAHMDVVEQLLRQHQIPAPEFVWPRRNGVV